MPKDKNNGREMTPDEKFRSFFSTTAVDIPEEMTRRDEDQPEEKPQKRFGLFGRGKAKQEADEAAEEQLQEMPTGEVRLGEDAQPEPEADLELMLKPTRNRNWPRGLFWRRKQRMHSRKHPPKSRRKNLHRKRRNPRRQ